MEKTDNRVREEGAAVKRFCVKEYADRQKVSVSTVRAWIRKGFLMVEQKAGKGGSIVIIEN
jgi:hypothetical protein